MPLQRVRDAENRMRNKLSNGPRRVQSNVNRILSIFIDHDDYSDHCIMDSQSILQREGIRQLPGI